MVIVDSATISQTPIQPSSIASTVINQTSNAPTSAAAPLLLPAAITPIDPMENRPSGSSGLHVAPQTGASALSPQAIRPTTTTDNRVDHRQSAVMAPNEDPSKCMMKTLIHHRLIVVLFQEGSMQWKENLTANSIAECIDSIHREIQSQKAVKIASILNSKPLPVENPEKYKVLHQYGIPLDDLRIGSLMQNECRQSELLQ
jgi:hypothetical protein